MNRRTRGCVILHTKSLIKSLLKIGNISIERVYFDTFNNDEILIVFARPYSRQVNRCPICSKKCPGYDSAGKLRRWRSLDLGSTRVYIEAFAPRVKCSKHGVIVAKVPWGRHNSDYTYDFETAVTWMALHATASDVSEFFRIKWHTVGNISRRVQESLESVQPSCFDDLEKIGIDETSYKKGHKYITVIVNHKTGALVWAKKGFGKEILKSFFEELTLEQRGKIKLVSADGAGWITDCINDYCPNAERCIDPFHVVKWANEALDEVRKAAVRLANKEAGEGKKAERSKKNKVQSLINMLY
jgi:transposase